MIRPRLAVPIHWGTLFPVGMHRVWPDRLVAPPLEFARLVADADCQTEVRVLSPGDSTTMTTGTANTTEPAATTTRMFDKGTEGKGSGR